MDDLTRIGIQTGTDKAYYHMFTQNYEPYFRPLRNKFINILEIGIHEGSSLRMLQSYFPNANIYAIDVNRTSVREYGPRIHTYLCDQTDAVQLHSLFGHLKFDIIIDDGSHVTSHQQRTLGILFPLLVPGGIYICEDIHTSFVPSCVDSQTTTLDLLKKKSFQSEYISSDAQALLTEHVSTVTIYNRATLPYKCWKCKQFYSLCPCGTNLQPSPYDSQTAVIVRV